MKRMILVVVTLLALSQLVACSKSAPKCGDTSTKDLVIQILKENSLKDNDYARHDLTLSNIVTSFIDKDTGKNSCEGQLAVDVVPLDGSSHMKYNKTIRFTSELNSEGKHYVSVSIR